jgi:hypothetical protein
VEDIIEVGNDLQAVKDALPHGQFLPWLKAEFGWSERSAQNFMSVKKAVEKAEAGEEITIATAKEIVAEARMKKRRRRQKTLPSDKLAGRLVTVLERYRERSDPKEMAELARHLREFADSLDSQKSGKKGKKE